MPAPVPPFDAATKPADGVREGLAWAVAEVELMIDSAQIDQIHWLRSKRQLSMRRGTTTVSFYFSGSKWNGTGFGIWLMTSMAIRDSRLGQWRRAHPEQASDSDDFLDHVVMSRDSDTVVWEPSGVAWNTFAGRDLAGLPEYIVQNLAAAFDTYSEPLVAVEDVPAGHLNALNVAAFSEWAFALDHPSDAEKVLVVALERRPILKEYVNSTAERLGIEADQLR